MSSMCENFRVSHVLTVGHMPPPVTGENICRFRICDQLQKLGITVTNVRRGDSSAWSGYYTAVVLLPGESWRGTVADVLLSTIWGARRVPVYWYFHNRSWKRFAALPAFLWNRIAAIRPVMITGDLHKVFARKGMKSFLLRNAPEPMFSVADGPKAFTKRLVFVGRVGRSKGFYDAFDVFKQLYDLDEQWRLDVYGSGDDVRSLVAPYGSAVTLHGWTDGERKRRGYEEGGIVLFPSRYKNETSPMVIIEALSQGVPVVAYDVGGVAEMLTQDGKRAGIALRDSEQNSEGIIRSIQAIAQGYEEYSRNALALFTELFGPERYAREVAELFAPILEGLPKNRSEAATNATAHQPSASVHEG